MTFVLHFVRGLPRCERRLSRLVPRYRDVDDELVQVRTGMEPRDTDAGEGRLQLRRATRAQGGDVP